MLLWILTTTLVNVNSSGKRFEASKFFDSTAESATLDRSFSTSTSSTFPQDKPYWICTKCRQATMDQKHNFGKVNNTVFPCCDACWRQFRLQMWLGLTFRILQIHLCFTTLWIPSPDGAFLGDKSRNYGEWVAIVVLLVITVSIPASPSCSFKLLILLSYSSKLHLSSTSSSSGQYPNSSVSKRSVLSLISGSRRSARVAGLRSLRS